MAARLDWVQELQACTRTVCNAGAALFAGGKLAVVPQDEAGTFRLPSTPLLGGETPPSALARSGLAEWDQTTTISPEGVIRFISEGSTTWFLQARLADAQQLDTHRGSLALRLTLLDRDAAKCATLEPPEVAEVVMKSWFTGSCPPELTVLSRWAGKAPSRIRAGSVCLDELDRVLLIQRNRGDRRWYEIPGGGVEASESPARAAVRELREETGLVGEPALKIARVFKEGREEHYYFMRWRAAASSAAGLDLRPDARPEWIRLDQLSGLAVWPKRFANRLELFHRIGWPQRPIDIVDSIPDVDLTLYCDW